MVTAAIIGIGSATPEPIEQERLWEDCFADHFFDIPRVPGHLPPFPASTSFSPGI